MKKRINTLNESKLRYVIREAVKRALAEDASTGGSHDFGYEPMKNGKDTWMSCDGCGVGFIIADFKYGVTCGFVRCPGFNEYGFKDVKSFPSYDTDKLRREMEAFVTENYESVMELAREDADEPGEERLNESRDYDGTVVNSPLRGESEYEVVLRKSDGEGVGTFRAYAMSGDRMEALKRVVAYLSKRGDSSFFVDCKSVDEGRTVAVDARDMGVDFLYLVTVESVEETE